MTYKKRRSVSQIMEEESITILRNVLPEEWVIHNYAPDYGIDCIVETFKYVDEEKSIAETLGEQFFVQVKSVKSIKLIKKNVYSRINVEISTKFNNEKSLEIDVITYPIEVSELLTVQAMGQASPVLLFLVDLENKQAYFLCLNDYIEKILLPDEPEFYKQESKTLYIPVCNKITVDTIDSLMFYARRSKLFGAFNKFNYQASELEYNDREETVIRFIEIIKKYDFWDLEPKWPILASMYNEICYVEKLFSCSEDERNTIIKDKFKIDIGDYDLKEFIHNLVVRPLWHQLSNLGSIYEEICKEWFLPTYFWHDLYR